MKVALFFLVLIMPSMAVHSARPDKKMKILMVVAEFPKLHDICMLNQMTGLIDRGHDVHIYAEVKGNTTVLQKDVEQYKLLDKTIFGDLPSDINQYDIVMFQLGHKLFDIKKTHNFKGKVVVSLRGYDITGFLKENPHAYDPYFISCDLFMPVCNNFKNILKQAGCPVHKIALLHSAIHCSKFKFKERNIPRYGIINIVSAGRFVEKKGFIYAIEAIGSLIKKYPQIRYTIIGEGKLKHSYKKLIKKLGLEDKIILEPWHTHEEYIAILDKAHIFVVPSITADNNDQEGIPNVLKEAMAMGLVAIATHHSGNPELITHGISGFLVPERNASAISRTIEYIITKPGSWTPMQLAATKKINNEFNCEKENDKLETILYRLLN
jgi:colanic acid/amylovoran biosynthesis glycosyltransferase